MEHQVKQFAVYGSVDEMDFQTLILRVKYHYERKEIVVGKMGRRKPSSHGKNSITLLTNITSIICVCRDCEYFPLDIIREWIYQAAKQFIETVTDL